MAIARVTHSAGWTPATNTGTTVTKAYSTNLTSGSLLVAVIGSLGSSAPDTVISSVSDGTQTWTVIPGASIGEVGLGRGIAIAYFANNQLTTTPTVTVTSGGSQTWALWLAEYTGVATTTPLEGQAESSQSGAGTVVMSGQTIAVASTALMISAAIYAPAGSGETAGTGYTRQYDGTPSGLPSYPFAIQDNIAGTGTQSVAWDGSVNDKTYWAGVAAAFKIAGGASGALPYYYFRNQ